MTKYKIKLMQTSGVILARCKENGELAGQRIAAADCLEKLGESYEDIKKRECPSPYAEGKPKKE